MKKADLLELAKIYVAVYKAFDVGERWTVKTAEKLLAHWFERQPDLAFVAEYDKQVVGAFVVGVKPWWDGNHLVDGEIFIHPDYQRKRIGVDLSKTVYKKALQKYAVTFFDTNTFKKTEFPLYWYLSQGFKTNSDWISISGNVKSILNHLEKKK